MRRLIIITMVAAITPHVAAQRTISAAPRFAGVAHHRWGYYPLGFFPYYDDALSTSGSPASQPQVIVLQSQPAPEAIPEKPPQPLMIELQGDHYVRIAADDTSGARIIGQESTHPPNALSPASQSATSRTLGPVVLLFRDGHREEVSDYTIADGILYASADFYTAGSWSRKIALSALNLPDTVETNRQRGMRFQLPTAPNEVIVGP